MATNPGVALGTLNRLISAVHVLSNPALNITAPYVGRNGIRVRSDRRAVVFIDAMTGMVTSPEPYIPVTVTAQLLRTQSLALAWKSRLVQNALIGQITAFPDTTPFLPMDVYNCAFEDFDPMNWDGTDPHFTVTLYGTYYINNTMWNQFTATAA